MGRARECGARERDGGLARDQCVDVEEFVSSAPLASSAMVERGQRVYRDGVI